MPKSFLPKSLHILFIVTALFVWLVGTFFTFFVVMLVYVGMYFLFRQTKLTYKDDVGFKNDVFYSPVSGALKRVRKNINHPFFGKNLTEVHLTVMPWNEYGIYLPFTCEVKELRAHRGKRLIRLGDHLTNYLEASPDVGIDLICEGVNGSTIGMKFVQCYLGGWPEIALLPGDRGKRRSNIGYFPYGGSLILYLPPETQLLLEEGDLLIAGVSVFAGLTKDATGENKL